MIRGNHSRHARPLRRAAAAAAAVLATAAALSLGACGDGEHTGRTYHAMIYLTGRAGFEANVGEVVVCQPPTDGAACPDEVSLRITKLSSSSLPATSTTTPGSRTRLARVEVPGPWESAQVEVYDSAGKEIARDLEEAHWRLIDTDDHGVGLLEFTLALDCSPQPPRSTEEGAQENP